MVQPALTSGTRQLTSGTRQLDQRYTPTRPVVHASLTSGTLQLNQWYKPTCIGTRTQTVVHGQLDHRHANSPSGTNSTLPAYRRQLNQRYTPSCTSGLHANHREPLQSASLTSDIRQLYHADKRNSPALHATDIGNTPAEPSGTRQICQWYTQALTSVHANFTMYIHLLTIDTATHRGTRQLDQRTHTSNSTMVQHQLDQRTRQLNHGYTPAYHRYTPTHSGYRQADQRYQRQQRPFGTPLDQRDTPTQNQCTASLTRRGTSPALNHGTRQRNLVSPKPLPAVHANSTSGTRQLDQRYTPTQPVVHASLTSGTRQLNQWYTPA
eukprot:gene12207-15336_t